MREKDIARDHHLQPKIGHEFLFRTRRSYLERLGFATSFFFFLFCEYKLLPEEI